MFIYGKQLIFYAVDTKAEIFEEIYLAKECDKKLFAKLARLNVPIKRLDHKKAQALAHGGNHQGFLAKIKPIELHALNDVKNAKFLLVLCSLSDVGNIGAIARTAYALGADGMIISGTQNINLEGILRTSSGAALHLPIVHAKNTLDLVNELHQSGFFLYAADAKGEEKIDKRHEKQALLLGSEGEGIPMRILSKCDQTLAIKMQRNFDSLNVSVACGILCYRILNG